MTDRTPRERWGTCCPSDPECDHSYLDDEALFRWMDTPISDEQANGHNHPPSGRDLRAAVAAANQRAEIAEENLGHAENDVDIMRGQRDVANQRAEQAEARIGQLESAIKALNPKAVHSLIDGMSLPIDMQPWRAERLRCLDRLRALVADQPDPDHRRHQ